MLFTQEINNHKIWGNAGNHCESKDATVQAPAIRSKWPLRVRKVHSRSNAPQYPTEKGAESSERTCPESEKTMCSAEKTTSYKENTISYKEITNSSLENAISY